MSHERFFDSFASSFVVCTKLRSDWKCGTQWNMREWKAKIHFFVLLFLWFVCVSRSGCVCVHAAQCLTTTQRKRTVEDVTYLMSAKASPSTASTSVSTMSKRYSVIRNVKSILSYARVARLLEQLQKKSMLEKLYRTPATSQRARRVRFNRRHPITTATVITVIGCGGDILWSCTAFQVNWSTTDIAKRAEQ